MANWSPELELQLQLELRSATCNLRLATRLRATGPKDRRLLEQQVEDN